MKENSICGDNRFEIIEKAKEMLLNATNIEDSKEEMKVLTNILFRMWQVGLINEEKLEINKLQKENSIEEDITKINTYIELVLEKDYCNCNELNTILGKHCDGSKNVAYAMQHILSDYKRVLKENEELNYKLHSKKIALEIYNRYIPKSKVKEKKEELKQERDETYTKFLGGNRTDENLSTRGKMIEGGIKVLQELLEESEE